MALNYTPPGVNIQEVVGTNVSPSLASPTTLCLVGVASGSINNSIQITLEDGDADGNPATPDSPVPVTLTGLPLDADLNSVVEVRDAFNGTLYTPGTDYTVNSTDRSITRSATGAITDGTVVRVQYNYTPADYFDAQRFDSFQAVEDRFGSAWSVDGLSIGSPLSHAALIAFQNGAPFVVLQPLYKSTGNGDKTEPTAADAAQATTWAATLTGLQIRDDINVVVPVVGELNSPNTGESISTNALFSIWSEVARFVWYQRTQEQFVFAIFGEDSSTGVDVTSASIINNALAYQGLYGGDIAESAVVVSPAKFVRETAAPNQTMYVGGQWVAVAIAGQFASRRVQTPLTRKPIVGFTQVAEKRPKEVKNAEAANGICVVEQRGTTVQVRHGVTTDNTSVARSEISVVRSKYFVVESLYNTFESQIIGQVVADTEAPVVVRTAVISTLEQVKSLGVISRYANVDARLLVNDPTTVEVRFSFTPLFPINHIDIIFSLDFANNTITNVLPGAGR